MARLDEAHHLQREPVDLAVLAADACSDAVAMAPGLDDDALASAFDRFWQADRARVGVATGLGLSIVQAIASEHGGTVSAGNARDAPGAVFTIAIAAVDTYRSTEDDTGASAPSPPAVSEDLR